MRATPAILAAIASLLIGCTQPLDTRIDGSSKEAYEKSLKAIKAKLSQEETKKLEEALQVVAVPAMLQPGEGGLVGMLAALKDPEKTFEKMLAEVNGKTPRELIAQADAKIKERAKEELKSVVSEIAELEKRKAGAEKAKELLSKITTTDPRYYWSSGFLPAPVIDFNLTNNSGVALSRVYFHGVVSTPGRSIAWIDKDFNYELPGGLENGETKHLRLSPNMFSGWGERETQGRKDLVLTITVVNAAGADKKKLAEEFGKSDAERLSKLIAMKVELEGKLKSRQ